jgi:hypothetical protein
MSATDYSDFRPPTSNSSADPHDSQIPASDSPTYRLPTPDSPAATFRARLESGDYRELLGERLGEVMAQAAAEAGVADELGALRIVMARLLTEEDDLVVLARLIARIASVSIQAARVQRAISGQLAESLTEALTTILADLEGGDG